MTFSSFHLNRKLILTREFNLYIFIILQIVRSINHLVKSRSHAVHSEALSVLLCLRIKDVNLDKEKEEQIKQKKFKTHRQKLLTMSKRERKVLIHFVFIFLYKIQI